MKGLLIVCILIFGTIGFVGWLAGGPSPVWGGFIGIAVLSVAGLVYFIFRDNKIKGGKSYRKADVADAIAKGYAFYLDGQQVDPATIDPNLYTSSVDDANRKVFLRK